MTRYRVALTAGAEGDLDAICDWLEGERGPDAVGEWLDRFEAAIGSLETFPERGAIPPELVALGIREFRQKPFKPYRIVYRVLEKRVFILLIAHARRDFQTLLQERLLRG